MEFIIIIIIIIIIFIIIIIQFMFFFVLPNAPSDQIITWNWKTSLACRYGIMYCIYLLDISEMFYI